jgi:hypothetical protein
MNVFPFSSDFIPLNSTSHFVIKHAKSYGLVEDYRLIVAPAIRRAMLAGV